MNNGHFLWVSLCRNTEPPGSLSSPTLMVVFYDAELMKGWRLESSGPYENTLKVDIGNKRITLISGNTKLDVETCRKIWDILVINGFNRDQTI